MDLSNYKAGDTVCYIIGMDIYEERIKSISMGNEHSLTNEDRTVTTLNGVVLTSDECFETHQDARNHLIQKAYNS